MRLTLNILTPTKDFAFEHLPTRADLAAGEKVCPVCSREVPNEFVPMLVCRKICRI